MAKKAIKFQRGWSRYNAGETAAFDAAQADDLIKQGIAVLAKVQPKEEVVTVSLNIDPRETDAFKEATAEIARAAQEVQDRAAELDKREASLADREAQLAAAEKAVDALDGEGDAPQRSAEADQGKAVAKPAGLPKQGR